GSDLAALDLKRERQASAGGPAGDDHRACAADAVLTTDMGTGRADLVAEKVGQQQPRLAGAVEGLAIEPETDAVMLVGAQAGHGVTSTIRERPIIRTRSRR